MPISHRPIAVTTLALGLALAAGRADASGFQLRENSVKAQGRAMAGSASAFGDAAAVSNNPALLATFQERVVQAEVTGIDLSFRFDGGGRAAAGSPLQQPLTGGNGGEAGDLTPVPALSVVLPLGDRFEYVTLGAMVSAPFGLKTDYDAGWVGRYHALKSDVRVIDLTLAASVDVGDRFSVGLGAIYQRAEVTLSNAIDFGSGICANPASQGLCFLPDPITGPYGPQKNDGTVSVEGTDYGLGWIAGFNWRPTDRLSLGYMHRSEIDHELSGRATFDVPAGVAAVFAGTGLYTSTGGGARLTLPSIDTLSATWRATERLSLMAEASRTDWHSLKEVRIEFENPVQADAAEAYEWDDSMFYALGGEFRLGDRLVLRAGVARDESPVSRPYRTPRMPDQDRNWYSVGLTWAPSANFELSASYVRIHLVERPELDLVSSSGSRLAGAYDGGADLYGVSAQYRF